MAGMCLHPGSQMKQEWERFMAKYLLKRLFHGLLCVIVVVMLIMIMIYSLLDRNLIFASDSVYNHQQNNQKVAYRYQKWEEYGYLDYVPYADFMNDLAVSGEIDEETRAVAVSFGRTEDKDSDLAKEYIEKFKTKYQSQGYKIERLDAVMMGSRKIASGGQQQLFAYKDIPLSHRLWNYFTGIFRIDNINEIENDVGDRGISFTLYDPVYGGEKFSPAIIGNGTRHKYLVYCDSKFPFIHQNMLTISLGTSYSVNMGVDVFTTMTKTQGSYVASTVTYPTGLTEESADDLHSATYLADSLHSSLIYESRYIDDYTSVDTVKSGLSKMGYSFLIGIIATVLAYLVGVPLGITMSRKKDRLVDKIGTLYIVFIIAVPSLAYIFLFKAIGGKLGLPTTFDMDTANRLVFVLPIISLALPQVANLMKWLRRYMIDQMNSDYVKFARAGGLSENEIFSKHILKNAAIPIIHGIPASVLGCLTGAIITERVYVVPGAGNLLTEAINKYDNGVIVGVSLFYAILSVISIILGDVLMSMVDPRISFSSKAR
jgi:oligopeptide transport system permease protein